MVSSRIQDKLATAVMWLAGILILVILITFLGYMLIKGLPVLSWNFITGMPSDINAGGGVGPQLFNSFYILGLSMLFSIPAAVGAGIYLAEYAGNDRLTDMIRLSTESLATVPSIVLGLFGMIIFVNIFGMVFSIIGGSLTLMLLNLPVLVRVTEESIRTVPAYYREASLALGAKKWQTIWRVTLPAAKRGVLTAIMLGLGRTIGETMAVMMVTGNAAVMPLKLSGFFSPVRTMTATIAAEMGEVASGSTHYHVLFLIGLVLFLISLGINITASTAVFSKKKRAERILS
jgi:phosphate transport system permease protein